MILKYWKYAVFAILLFGAFTMGKRWEAAAYEKTLSDMANATSQAIAAREAEIAREHKIQVEADAVARGLLQSDLATLRERERELITHIDNITLVTPIPELRIEGCTDDGETTLVLANPFSVDFVRLWNESSRRNPAE